MAFDITSVSLDKVISMAIRSEMDAAAIYKKLLEKVNNFVLRDKFQFLAEEEVKHQRVLESLFTKLFKGKSPEQSAKSLIPRLSLALDEDMTVPDLIELAMEAEKTSEEIYDSLSQEVEERGVQQILQYLASMEHGHYSLLKGEYDLCLKDEMYYQRGDFQYDMVHIGP